MYLEIKHLHKTIGGAEVLRDVCLQLERGRIYGLLGEPAALAALLDILCGRMQPTAGEVVIGGERLGRDISFPRSLGLFMGPAEFVPHCTGRRNLELLASVQRLRTKKEVAAVLWEVGLDPADRQKNANYSPAKQQRLGVAAAVVNDPELIVLHTALSPDAFIREALHRRKARGALVILTGENADAPAYYADETIVIPQPQTRTE